MFVFWARKQKCEKREEWLEMLLLTFMIFMLKKSAFLSKSNYFCVLPACLAFSSFCQLVWLSNCRRKGKTTRGKDNIKTLWLLEWPISKACLFILFGPFQKRG
jgi:hypothetical protein